VELLIIVTYFLCDCRDKETTPFTREVSFYTMYECEGAGFLQIFIGIVKLALQIFSVDGEN